MPWIYYDNEDFTFYEAFDQFFNNCIISEETLKKELEKRSIVRCLISTEYEHDKITCIDNKVFLKSKFLINKSFKKRLIDYYKPLNIYVNGPNQILKTNGEKINKWIIELTKIV